MKTFDGAALLLEFYYARNYLVQSLGYLSYEGVHDLNISPDFFSDPDSSLSREKSGHAWSAAVMSLSDLITSLQASACSDSSDPRDKDQLQGNLRVPIRIWQSGFSSQ